MKEPTRPIHQPTVERDGSLVAHTVATPTAFKVRARVTIGSRRVIPVIFVPGIMGSNLRARRDLEPQLGDLVKPGESAWRPPSSTAQAFKEARKWSHRSPAQRQRILNASTLEVDPDGDLAFAPNSFDPALLRQRGWGQVHAGSYGALLVDLQGRLDKTFQVSPQGTREIRHFWRRVMQCQPARWGVRSFSKVTEAELEKYASFQYPVYAFGYNWLESCDISARHLRKRIDEIKKFWLERKHDCTSVILITHSMGGLVARACARLSESGGGGSDIAGVIHAVMPALGAPVAYRRIACGTEGGQYANGMLENIKSSKFAEIAGDTTAETTPVMALSAGILQLLPNQLYPRPWLMIKTLKRVNQKDEVRDLLSLPDGNPYDFYRDMESWYRMIDPDLASPEENLAMWKDGGIRKSILAAISEAERFHRDVLSLGGPKNADGKPYYHPNTYAFYGADHSLKTYGQIRWVAREPSISGFALTPANVRAGTYLGSDDGSARTVQIEQGGQLRFAVWPQDTHGDETVPVQSGAGAGAHVRQIFAPAGFRHQDSFQHEDMLLLTRHIIVKIVQEVQ